MVNFHYVMQSVSLWCDYLNFVQEYDPMVRDRATSRIKKGRDLFERALTAAGLHFTEAEKLWEAYREFEKSIYQSIDETDTQVRTSFLFLFLFFMFLVIFYEVSHLRCNLIIWLRAI